MVATISSPTPPMLSILWLTDGVEGTDAFDWRSTLASNRYRAILPARALIQAGHQVRLVPIEGWRFDPSALRPDVIVVGKLLPGGPAGRFSTLSQNLLREIATATASGVRVLADFNDDHFDRPDIGSYWRRLAQTVRGCVAGSDTMADRLRRLTPAPIFVVGDPLASSRGEPRVFQPPNAAGRWVRGLLGGAANPSRLKLVWYGHPINWPAMRAWLSALEVLRETQPYLLWVVTQPHPMVQADLDAHNHRAAPGGLAELIPWDEEVQWATVADSDVVLIPSDPSDPKKAVKTSNRLTDALNAGRLVIASPLPAYQPYEDHALMTDDPLAALRRMLADPAAALNRVREGQLAAQAHCSLDVVSKSWAEAFASELPAASLLTEPDAAQQPLDSPIPPVRLNLGCGDKILDGFVNVDLAENWSGRSPDVVADITQRLPFNDNSIDEIHAYHVLEHIDRWKVPECLRDWVRVLRPGGRLILELPCLDKILSLYQYFNGRDENPPERLTLWGLYGDPNYCNPAMMHRWCYSTNELTILLEMEVGLVHIAQSEPQTHISIRDMRITGEKPL